MKSKLILLILGVILSVPESHAQKAQALKWAVTLITGAAAAKSFERADVARSVYKQNDEVIQNMKAQGIDPKNGAIYSLYFSLNGNVSSVMWADILNKPDIFAIVQIEGQGTFLIPDVHNEYAGQPILDNIIAKNATPGARILVRILDDDSLSNAIWNQILQSRINYRFTSEISCTSFARVNVEANGSIRLLDRNIVIDAPDDIATAEFKVPISPDGRWLATGDLRDSKNIVVGKLQFAQIFRADPKVVVVVTTSHSHFVFWSVFGGVCLLVAVTALFFKNQKTTA